jgi:DnaK suppressor protein
VDAPVDGSSGRYERLFPELAPLGGEGEALLALGTVGGVCDGGETCEDATETAAGWPLFGRFIAHDITADRSPLTSRAELSEAMRGERFGSPICSWRPRCEDDQRMSTRQPPIDETHARELLQRERARIESSLADLHRVRQSELDEIDTDANPVDDAEVISDEQVEDALAEQLREELEAIERAEKRLEDGTYGFSVSSGEPIPQGRLEAIPWAERTAEEQERYERTRGRAP